MSHRWFASAALLVALLLGSVASAQNPPPPATPEGLLSFAGSLLREGDSFRAATEYLRFLHHYSESPGHLEALEGLGRAYALANRYDEATGVFRRLLAAEATDPDQVRWLLGSALYRGKHHAEAAQVLFGGSSRSAEEATHTLGTLALLRDEPETTPPAGARQELIDEFQNLRRKSPAVAGTLSAVLPGAGHFYAGRPRDGTISFALNAVFIWGVYEAWQRENWPLVGILGFFELGWYTGNIVSSVNAAHKWNRRAESRFFHRWEESALPQWQLSLGPDSFSGALSWRW